MRGIRLGCDVSRFALPFMQPDRKAAIEFSIDTEWKPNFFPTGELGFENIQISNDYINYRSNAVYARIGYDKNILKHDAPRYRDMFFYGYRYGVSVLHQEVSSFTIKDSLWSDFSGDFPAKTLQAHWLELVFGTRASLTNAIFIGFSARVKLKVYSQKDVNYPYVIPGFGNGKNTINFGFNYSVYFQIPVKKVKIEKKSVAESK